MPSHILIADDQTDILDALRLLLKNHGYAIETVTSPTAMLDLLAQREFDLILMDLNYARDTTSGREGINLLMDLKNVPNAPPIVVMTGWASIPLAVEAMQQGVVDFVEKPWVNSRLLETVKRQIRVGVDRREAKLALTREDLARAEITAQFHRQESEVEEARAIQQRLLPRDGLIIPGVDIATFWQPARVVAGDYFDMLSFDDGTVALCIADVAGKGLPAALLMANLQAAVRSMASASLPPDRLCTQLNAVLLRNIGADRFITLFYAQYDAQTGELLYTNAGHNAPIVLRRDGSHERLDVGGGVLGVFAGQSFCLGKAKLSEGDRLVLFTDGLTETNNLGLEEFGEKRLLELLKEHRALAAEELRKKLMSATTEFNGGNWEDDATLLVLAVA
jgi:sigma-B regulation protein RsbU (phosphoserine phosphatase)